MTARDRSRHYRARHRNKTRVYARTYRVAHRSEVLESLRAYGAAHRAEKREYNRVYKKAHREEICTFNRVYYTTHLEESRKRARAYKAAHRAALRERSRSAWQDNPRRRDMGRAAASRRRARTAGNGGSHTAAEWRGLVSAMGNRCAYCGALGEAQSFQVEHRLPIAHGGCDCIANIAPACRACNASKGTMMDRAYLERRRCEGRRVRLALLVRPYCLEHSARAA